MMLLFHLLAGVSAAAAAAAYVPGKAFDRFITIWLENQDFSEVDVNSNIVNLSKEGILLTEYYALTHPSQPNYIASVGGDYFGLNDDGFVRIPKNVSTVVDLFDAKNIEWKGYFEGVPGPGYMGEGSTITGGTGWDYVRKHNPFVSYDSINLNSTRLAQLQGFENFQRDLTTNSLPQYAHMSPDMLNDGHNTSLAYAASWATSFLTPLLANEQFMENTLILLTYDESVTYSEPNHIVSLLLGGAIPTNLKGTKDNTLYTHYSILSTLENNWDLPNLGRYDVGANVFQFVADKTGYTNHVGDVSSVDNSVSYAGFLNDKPDAYKPIPPPNLQLIGAGGQGVDAMVLANWQTVSAEETPYYGNGDLYDGVDAPVYKPQGPNANFTSLSIASAARANKSGAPKMESPLRKYYGCGCVFLAFLVFFWWD